MAITTPEKKIRSAWTRHLTAAKRSLGIIMDEAAKHQALLDEGKVPDTGFSAAMIRYEQVRQELILLGTLTGTGEEAGNGLIEVQGSDLGLLLGVLAQFGVRAQDPDGPLARLHEAAGIAPAPAVSAPTPAS